MPFRSISWSRYDFICLYVGLEYKEPASTCTAGVREAGASLAEGLSHGNVRLSSCTAIGDPVEKANVGSLDERTEFWEPYASSIAALPDFWA